MKLQVRFVVRTLAIAVFASVIGFSYAIVTQASANAPTSSSAVASRSVGSGTLRLLAPVFIPNDLDCDLGDALFGTVITRYVTATGGLRPFSFSSTGTPGKPSDLIVLPSGVATGMISATGAPPTVSFSVFVTTSAERDIANTPTPSATKIFHLAMFPTGSQVYRFANDHLNNGVLGQAYIGKVDTIGGKGSVVYTIVAGTVTLNGQPLGTGNSLEDAMGLSFATDGTLYGRPLKTGLITFKAHAVDSAKRVAKDRTNSVFDQLYTFNIENGNVTASDATILAISTKGDTALVNADSLKFTAFMNLGGKNPSALTSKVNPDGSTTLINNQFSFLFGSNVYSGFLNNQGKVLTPQGQPLIFPDGTALKCTVDPVNGTITGQLLHANLSAGVNATAIENRSTKRVAVAIIIYNIVVATDTVEFQTKHIGTKYALTYLIGRTGRPLGGVFQVFDARGSDAFDIGGNPADTWISKFLIAPRFGIDDIDNETVPGYSQLTNINVRIGTKFIGGYPDSNTSQIVPIPALALATKKNGSISYISSGNGAYVKSLTINPASLSGIVITNALSINTTGLPQAHSLPAATANFFNLGIDINRPLPASSFTGEDAKALINAPTFNKWIDRNTKKPKP